MRECLFTHAGVAVVLKCVSCTQRMSHFRSRAVFQSECLFAGWFTPFALRDSTVIGIVGVVWLIGELHTLTVRYRMVVFLDSVYPGRCIL